MIYISTVSKRGNSHSNWNEDNLYYLQGHKSIVGGVFDGCSSGKDSYFASKLFANIFRTSIGEFQDEITIDNFHLLVHLFIKNSYKAINIIGLCTEETLSTAVLFVYEIENSNLLVKFFGDGVVYANNDQLEVFNNDEANQPDYIGYSIANLLKEEQFLDYWNRKKCYRYFTKDFSVSTDGIFSFKKRPENPNDINIEEFVAKDTFLYKNPSSLKRKLNILTNKGYEHDDDITIIRIINEQSHGQS